MMRSGLVLLVATWCATLAMASGPPIIDTIAGGGGPAGTPATTANLNAPSAVVVGPGGDLFIAAAGHNRIYRIDESGLLVVVAGTGGYGFSGDDGPATDAQLAFPQGLAFDPAGNLLIADSSNSRVRRIDQATGIITTIAGNGVWGSAGNGGPATSASLQRPIDLAFDAAGNLYILDWDGSRVRRVTAATGIITTYAGGGFNQGDGFLATFTAFSSPSAIAFDAGDNLLIAQNHKVRRVDRVTSIVSTVAGTGQFGFAGDGGPATAALLDSPRGIALDAAGNILIAVDGNNRIRRVDRLTGIITTIAGSGAAAWSGDGGAATAAGIKPRDVAVGAGGTWFILDGGNNRIRMVDDTGTITTVAGNGDCCFYGEGVPARDAELTEPADVAVDGAGNIFVLDGARVRRVDRRTGIIATVAGNGTSGYTGDGGPATSASFRSSLNGLAVDTSGNLYIADPVNYRIRRVDALSGIIETVAGNGSPVFNGEDIPAISAGMRPAALAAGPDGDVFLIDSWHLRVRRIDMSTGIIRSVAGNGLPGFSGNGQPALASTLYFPWDISLDDEGNLFIAEGGFNDDQDRHGSNRIRRVDVATGILSTVAGTGAFYSGTNGIPATSSGVFLPNSVTVDRAGNIYFSERTDEVTGSFHGGVRGVNATTGIVDRVTGPAGPIPNCSFPGEDGGPAIDANLCFARGLATDAGGNLFMAANNRVRWVHFGNSPPIAHAGDDLSVPCASTEGALVTLDGSASYDLDSAPGTSEDIVSWEWFLMDGQPGGTLLGSGETLDALLPGGPNTVSLRVTDREGAVATDTLTASVVPGAPTDLRIDLSTTLLWPPNHRMVAVNATPSASTCAPPLYTLLAVTSSEPDDAPGGSDGKTTGDIQDASPGQPDFSIELRAERDAGGPGRVYQLTYRASNAAGELTASVQILVPHDLRHQTDPIALGVTQTPAGTLLEWDEIAGGVHYNVIRGDLAGLEIVDNGVTVQSPECLASRLTIPRTAGHEDTVVPEPGQIIFYLAEYDDGAPTGYGAPEALLPLLVPSGICP